MEIIAELGSTWWRPNKALDNVECSIRMAAKCAATVVKFQLWKANKLYSQERAPVAYERAKKYEFPLEWLPLVKEWCGTYKVDLWASVFDVDTAKEAVPFLSALKIASGDLTNVSLLSAVADLAEEHKIPLAISTGAATGDEVRSAIELVLPKNVMLYVFQCVSSYPASPYDYNLDVTMSSDFLRANKFGLSDHTYHDDLAKVAVGAGYELFEKHLMSYDTPMDCPDARVASNPIRFSRWVEGIRSATKMLGSSKKIPQPDEMSERVWVRRGKDGLRPGNE